MKTTYFRFLTLILFVCSFAFTACKKDNEEPSNALEFDGENIPLVKGFIYEDNNNETKGYYVTVTSEAVTAEGGECIDLDGTSLRFDLIADGDTDSLPVGTYSLGTTIDYAVLITNYNPQTNNFDGYLEGDDFTAMSVTVSKSGETYTFDFTFSYTKNGQSKTAKGRFKGTLSGGILCGS